MAGCLLAVAPDQSPIRLDAGDLISFNQPSNFQSNNWSVCQPRMKMASLAFQCISCLHCLKQSIFCLNKRWSNSCLGSTNVQHIRTISLSIKLYLYTGSNRSLPVAFLPHVNIRRSNIHHHQWFTFQRDNNSTPIDKRKRRIATIRGWLQRWR